jgi:phosphoribosyl-ATP pyrophosphohydrolase
MTFQELFQVIEERKRTLPEGSSTTTLLTRGLDSILPKLNEESFETALALECQGPDEVALEVSQCFYYLLCLAVFLGEKFDGLELDTQLNEEVDRHELAKRIARSSADLCHTPCLSSINAMPPLLLKALELGNTNLKQMFSHL